MDKNAAVKKAESAPPKRWLPRPLRFLPGTRKPAPTDRVILEAIYARYYDEFAAYTKKNPSRASKIYVPIDTRAIADDLGVDGDLVFGRLYYDLEYRYGYRQPDEDGDVWVRFFALAVGGDRHCINFPYMASVLANLRAEVGRFRLATGIALVSLLVAIVSLFFALG